MRVLCGWRCERVIATSLSSFLYLKAAGSVHRLRQHWHTVGLQRAYTDYEHSFAARKSGKAWLETAKWAHSELAELLASLFNALVCRTPLERSFFSPPGNWVALRQASAKIVVATLGGSNVENPLVERSSSLRASGNGKPCAT